MLVLQVVDLPQFRNCTGCHVWVHKSFLKGKVWESRPKVVWGLGKDMCAVRPLVWLSNRH